MTWSVGILGDTVDLDALSMSLCAPNLRLVREKEEFFLQSSCFDALDDASAVREAASQLVSMLNGSAKLVLGSVQDLKVGHVVHADETGRKHFYVTPEPAVLHMRALPPTVVLTRRDGTTEVHNPADAIVNQIALARSDSAVKDVLRLFGTQKPDWASLYRIFELVQADLGGDRLQTLEGVTRRLVNRFTQTANSPQAAGDAARHAVPRGDPPENPMQLGEAKSFITGLVFRWLEVKQPDTGPGAT